MLCYSFHLKLFLTDFTFAKNQLSFSLIDSYLSLLLLIAVIVFILLKKSSIKYFQTKINFTNTIIIILMFIFIFAPAISNFNPDFQKDLKVTRLLPPFSIKKVLHLKYQSEKKLSEEDEFILIKIMSPGSPLMSQLLLLIVYK